MLRKILFTMLFLLLLAGMANAGPEIEAAYVNDTFIIDGRLNDGVWTNAQKYTEMFGGFATSYQTDLYLAHDNDFLYIGIDTPVGAGWDAHTNIFIDGNHDHTYTSIPTSPNYDIIATRSAPGAWSGYNAYWEGDTRVTPPTGYQSAAYNDGTVSYEYKLPIFDFAKSLNDTIGIEFMFNTGISSKTSTFLFPASDIMKTSDPNWMAPRADVAGWADLTFQPSLPFQPGVPEPTTLVLFGIGLLGLAGISRRKSNQ